MLHIVTMVTEADVAFAIATSNEDLLIRARYLLKSGIPSLIEEGLLTLQMFATQGCTQASYHLGLYSLENNDPVAAVAYLETIHKQHEPEGPLYGHALFELAKLYAADQRYNKARKYYRWAAIAGHIPAYPEAARTGYDDVERDYWQQKAKDCGLYPQLAPVLAS